MTEKSINRISFNVARKNLIALFYGAVLLGGCSLFSSADDIQSAVSGDPRISFEALRAKDPQAKLGAKEHPKILASYGGAYKNEKLEHLLAPIAGALVTHTDSPERAFSITVLNSPTVNAFALPGGYLYVTRGLLALANDESEVAAVLAHEIAHVSSNHGIERSKQMETATIVERVVSDVVTNDTAKKVAKASSKKRLAAFSQQQELQADAVGIKLLGKAGFDAFAAARFLVSMDRFTAWRSAFNTNADDMSSSHPSTPRRIELARRHARALGPELTRKGDRSRFLKGVNGLRFGDSEKEGFVRERTFSHRRLNIKFEVPPRFELSNRAEAVLAAGPGETALRFDAVSSRNQGSPVEYLKSGWVNGLLVDSVKAGAINSFNAATGRAIAGDWQFAVTVIAKKDRYFRFILAAPKNDDDIGGLSKRIVSSFKTMSAAENAGLRPLKVHIVKANSGDDIKRLASRMRGVSNPVQLFRALNSLGSSDKLVVGKYYKLILD